MRGNQLKCSPAIRYSLAAIVFFSLVTRAVAGPDFTPIDYPVGNMPTAILVYDFNHDGKPDIAVINLRVGNGNGTVSVLLGNGDGTFQSQKVSDVGGPNPTSVAVADFNGDGKLDLAIGISSQGGCTGSSVYILLGNGDGTFQPSVQAVNVPSNDVLVTAGDVNADGKPDLVVLREQVDGTCSPQGGFSIFLGNGDGTFQPEQDLGGNFLDVNGDGIPDLGSSFGLDGPLTIFLGQGKGRYLPLATGPEGNTGFLTLGDFNHDNKQDQADWFFIPCKGIFCEGGTAYVGIVLGNGDGTFQPPQLFPPGGYPWSPFDGGGITEISPGDFNGDGNLDVAFINFGTPGFRVLLGKGDGTMPSLLNFDTGSGPGYFVVSDLSGDGRPDVVLSNLNDATITVAINTFPTTGADLAVQIAGNPDLLSVTQTLTYTVTVQNLGPQDATNVVLTNTLPSTVNFVSLATNQGTCTEANLVVVCNISKLVSGDALVATIAVVPTTPGTITDSATATASQTDTNTANNTASHSTAVDPLFNLNITIFGSGTGTVSVSSSPPLPGGIVNCSSSCTASMPVGYAPLMVAIPDPNMGFGGWGGACAGITTQENCGDFPMNSDLTVTAEFDQLPNFVMAFDNWTPTVTPGGSVTVNLGLGPEGPDGSAFDGTITLTCAVQGKGAPAPTCTLSPASVTVSGTSGGSSALTIKTTGPSAALAPLFRSSGVLYALSLPLLGAILVGLKPRRAGAKGRAIVGVLVAMLLLADVALQVGCSGGSNNVISHGGGGTPPGNNTVTVSGVSGANQKSVTLTLTVQ
jgi:uncharacterized repeat protein (TIGR01451 family)